jgi:hypothetical protein
MDMAGLILVIVHISVLYLWAGIAISFGLMNSTYFDNTVFERILVVICALTWPVFIPILFVFFVLYVLTKWIITGDSE